MTVPTTSPDPDALLSACVQARGVAEPVDPVSYVVVFWCFRRYYHCGPVCRIEASLRYLLLFGLPISWKERKAMAWNLAREKMGYLLAALGRLLWIVVVAVCGDAVRWDELADGEIVPCT